MNTDKNDEQSISDQIIKAFLLELKTSEEIPEEVLSRLAALGRSNNLNNFDLVKNSLTPPEEE